MHASIHPLPHRPTDLAKLTRVAKLKSQHVAFVATPFSRKEVLCYDPVFLPVHQRIRVSWQQVFNAVIGGEHFAWVARCHTECEALCRCRVNAKYDDGKFRQV